ncbi:hypothetical protein GE061_014928 [Apolygus lucorum]|uniref:Peptidase S8 pro-domain domain-containing protein n=1 Tax=Apolygus lucorum TaxID=248454 RepID=A0A8S9XJL7_APOLU|nr:hypothetical protein GE061_014928 [Apolygus lucorum]
MSSGPPSRLASQQSGLRVLWRILSIFNSASPIKLPRANLQSVSLERENRAFPRAALAGSSLFSPPPGRGGLQGMEVGGGSGDVYYERGERAASSTRPVMWLSTVVLFSALVTGSPLYTNQFAVRIKNGDPDGLALKHGFTNVGQIGSLDGYFLFEHPKVKKRSITKHSGHHENLRKEPQK